VCLVRKARRVHATSAGFSQPPNPKVTSRTFSFTRHSLIFCPLNHCPKPDTFDDYPITPCQSLQSLLSSSKSKTISPSRWIDDDERRDKKIRKDLRGGIRREAQTTLLFAARFSTRLEREIRPSPKRREREREIPRWRARVSEKARGNEGSDTPYQRACIRIPIWSGPAERPMRTDYNCKRSLVGARRPHRLLSGTPATRE